MTTPVQVGLRTSAVHNAPCYPQQRVSSLGRPHRRRQAAAVSRILISSVLAVVLSGGAPTSTGLSARPAHPFPTGLVAQARPAAGQPPRKQFGWPLPGSPAVIRAFHPPSFRYGPGHRGVDLAAVAGAPVLAAGAGMVIFAGMVAGHGVVSVSHQGGLRTTYEPVSAIITAGQRVTKGERIGTVQPGHAGCPGTVCLHWGAFRDPAAGGPTPAGPDPGRGYLNPLRLIITARVRLLPIDGAPPHP
jgi:murein DD-endopeptidase MepM/ murein hydrolase activator NlpD